MKKRLSPDNQNMNITAHALLLLECLVKNCGTPVHSEVFSKEFLENLRNLARVSTFLFKVVYSLFAKYVSRF